MEIEEWNRGKLKVFATLHILICIIGIRLNAQPMDLLLLLLLLLLSMAIYIVADQHDCSTGNPLSIRIFCTHQNLGDL